MSTTGVSTILDATLSGTRQADASIAATPRLRHLASVRIAHWLMVVSVFGLMVSGTGILISHPRLYWGETGGNATPSLIDLPLPFIIGPSVWNRPIHFLFAWFLVFAGLIYVAAGLLTRHVRRKLLPRKHDLNWRSIAHVTAAHLSWQTTHDDDAWTYNVVQRLIYLWVLLVIFPGIIWTGLAMSFGVTSVFPFLATLLGGQQSARTLHFVFVALLVLFFVVHMAMLCLVGFKAHVQAMITGRIPKQRSTP